VWGVGDGPHHTTPNAGSGATGLPLLLKLAAPLRYNCKKLPHDLFSGSPT
jgi:hypothetical protein